jgi:hypothetical protein
MTGAWLPIHYRDFYDVPRMLVVEYSARLYLLDAPFDEEADEYADVYTVYRLPDASRHRVELDSWGGLAATGERIGQVPVAEVEFDDSKRRLINDEIFRRLGIAP